MADKILRDWDRELSHPKKKKDKKLSLHPLSFDEALKNLLSVKPEKKIRKGKKTK